MVFFPIWLSLLYLSLKREKKTGELFPLFFSALKSQSWWQALIPNWPKLPTCTPVPLPSLWSETLAKSKPKTILWSQSMKADLALLFSHSVVSDSLWLHGLQHTMLPCPSPSPRACSSSCPLNQWCHPTISSSVISFSSCPQSFPASGFFPMRQLFASGGQSIGASASASVLPMNIQGWFPLGLTGWISLQSKGLSRVFSKKNIK